MLKRNGQYTRHFDGSSEGEGGDSTMAEFYDNPVTGKVHIRFRFPGDKHFSPDFEATEEYQNRYRAQWAAFKEGRDQTSGQTLIDHVAWIDEATAGMLKYEHGIRTVEQLAEMTDANLSGVGLGAADLRTKARAHVMDKEASSETTVLRDELAVLRAEMAEMKAAQAAPVARAPKKARAAA